VLSLDTIVLDLVVLVDVISGGEHNLRVLDMERYLVDLLRACDSNDLVAETLGLVPHPHDDRPLWLRDCDEHGFLLRREGDRDELPGGVFALRKCFPLLETSSLDFVDGTKRPFCPFADSEEVLAG